MVSSGLGSSGWTVAAGLLVARVSAGFSGGGATSSGLSSSAAGLLLAFVSAGCGGATGLGSSGWAATAGLLMASSVV